MHLGNCPDNQTYFRLIRCDGTLGTDITLNTTQTLEASPYGYVTGDVIFAESTGKCYSIGTVITGTQGLTQVDITDSRLLPSCYQCTNNEAPGSGEKDNFEPN